MFSTNQVVQYQGEFYWAHKFLKAEKISLFSSYSLMFVAIETAGT
jgi:hypothetical protein